MTAIWHDDGSAWRLLSPPGFPAEDAGMVTVYNSQNGTYLQFWRKVIERRAPTSLPRVERAAAPAKVGQGSTTWNISDELLDALTGAYREAARGHLSMKPSSDPPGTH